MPEFNLDVSLDAHRGSFHLQVECRFTAAWTVIFGPSGSGKSTLLRLLAGLDQPAHGRVTLGTQILTDTRHSIHTKPGERRTGMVAQHPALFPHLTASQNVAYGIRALDRAARARRVDEMLELAGASELAALRPADLSGGQAQRVALARTLASQPHLLLLDEPLSALDGTASDALLERIEIWLHSNHIQTIMATHDAADALALDAEVLLLSEGKLAAMGPAGQVLHEERNRLLKRLQGETTP